MEEELITRSGYGAELRWPRGVEPDFLVAEVGKQLRGYRCLRFDRRVSSTMKRANADSLAEVVHWLARWQQDAAPVQLHPATSAGTGASARRRWPRLCESGVGTERFWQSDSWTAPALSGWRSPRWPIMTTTSHAS